MRLEMIELFDFRETLISFKSSNRIHIEVIIKPLKRTDVSLTLFHMVLKIIHIAVICILQGMISFF